MIIIDLPKKEELYWTTHAKEKMRQYQLSEQRVRRVLRHPDRVEKGIAPNTIAAMQVAGSKKNHKEIWLMYQNFKRKDKAGLRIITTWRYPGKSPVGENIPIPEEIVLDLKKIL